MSQEIWNGEVCEENGKCPRRMDSETRKHGAGNAQTAYGDPSQGSSAS